MFFDLSDILSGKISPPQSVPPLQTEYKGVKINIYGVLHGLLGGTNKEYVKFINKSIALAPGIKVSEKSMKAMYRGIDFELEDWLEMPIKDGFKLGFLILGNPILLYRVIKTIFIEKLRVNDKFENNKKINNLGGSPYFHLISPMKSRLLMGFPPSEDYLLENINRRKGVYKLDKIKFPDTDWKWLTSIERYVNIPLRSLHMIEYAIYLANKHKKDEVSIFVGESHSSDIFWYINEKNNDQLNKEIENEANRISNNINKLSPFSLFTKRIKYFLSLVSGVLSSFILYLIIIMGFIHYFFT